MTDICAARHRGSETSTAANEAIEEHKHALCMRVLHWFRAFGPATCEECSDAMEMRYTTASARISELKRDGWLVPTGERRKTSTGAAAAVLRAPSEQERQQRRLFT